MSDHEGRIDILYGHVELYRICRTLSDGSLEFGCMVFTYNNKPSEPRRLESIKESWGGMRLYAL